jgi:hypothetical protein
MMVPLDFLVPSFGRWRARFDARDESSPLIEEEDDEFVVVDSELGSRYSGWSVTLGILDDEGEAILLPFTLLCNGYRYVEIFK